MRKHCDRVDLFTPLSRGHNDTSTGTGRELGRQRKGLVGCVCRGHERGAQLVCWAIRWPAPRGLRLEKVPCDVLACGWPRRPSPSDCAYFYTMPRERRQLGGAARRYLQKGFKRRSEPDGLAGMNPVHLIPSRRGTGTPEVLPPAIWIWRAPYQFDQTGEQPPGTGPCEDHPHSTIPYPQHRSRQCIDARIIPINTTPTPKPCYRYKERNLVNRHQVKRPKDQRTQGQKRMAQRARRRRPLGKSPRNPRPYSRSRTQP